MPYKCEKCGYTSVEWMGRCPKCGDWDSFRQKGPEEEDSEESLVDESPKPLSEISFDPKDRISTDIGELDRVLGGGLIPGSVTLLGGDPGIGKSTLLLQAATKMAGSGKVLYISGEESSKQLKMRAERLDLSSANLIIYSGQSLETAISHINEIEPICVIVDSIQSLQHRDSTSSLGSTKQVRELGREFTRLAKKKEIATLLIGHITKSGDFSGPKTIEHLVDCTLYFEGKRDNDIRMMRPEKNRFGSTRLLGLFQMTEAGLQEILNPSQFFAKKNGHADHKGTATVCTIEGTRPILVEIQALVTPSNSGGNPQRRTTGLNYNRTSLLFVVIQKQLGINLQEFDIYLNVVGGFKVEETAADLGIVSAILSSFQNKQIKSRTVIIGEVGLSGEIRPVKNLKSRVQEAKKLGYQRSLIPEDHVNLAEIGSGVNLNPVNDISTAIAELGLKE